MHAQRINNGALRAIGIDPIGRGIAYGILEGPERLIDWGVARLWSPKQDEFLARVEALVHRWKPDLIVVEAIRYPKRRGGAVPRLDAVEEYARSRRIAFTRVSREQVKQAFAASGGTKYDIAVALAREFPELEIRLPRKPSLLVHEDEKMQIFDAISFAVTAMQ